MNWYKTSQSYNTSEEALEWLTRHNINKEGGKYVFYHGTPKTNKFKELRSGALLAESKDDAIHFAKRDRGLKSNDIIVYKILVGPEDINIGNFASLNKEYILNELV
jgi:hypothetical protein